MADSDKNILISPQRGSSTDSPSITLTGDGNDPISIYALDGTVGALSFEASAGQLFSITNNLTSGSIFSVNDVSGIPSIDVNSSGTVQIAPFGGAVALGQTTVTTGTVFDVKGDVRIDGDLSITSTTLVSNLNADLLDGQQGSYYTGYTDTAIANLIDSSPGTLNTLNELAAALGDDANFSTTVTNSIATKLPKSGGQMTGNITFSGSQTVDGRDLSADGSKLDGIESGATADQTAAEILTAIKTVDGSGSGLDADTLDGIQASSFLRSDAADTSSGVLTLSGAGSDRLNIYNTTNAGEVGIRFSDNTNQGQNGRIKFRHSDATSPGSAYGANFQFSTDQPELAVIIDGDGDYFVGTNKVWNAGNDGSGSGLDADLLDGVQGSNYLRSDQNDTLSGNLTVNRLFLGGSSNGGFDYNSTQNTLEVLTTNGSTHSEFNANAFVPGSHNTKNLGSNAKRWAILHSQDVKIDGNTSWHAGNDGAGSGLDADTLDGINSGSFLRSDVDDTFSGNITFSSYLISNARDKGLFGVYDSTKTDQIWSMGTAYRNHASGTNFGNLYGIAYKHTNNSTGGNMGGGHQMVWCQNGSPRGAIGADYVWHISGMRVGSNNHTVWHAGNDGTGSGLDADLLDGQHGSYYLNYNNFSNTPTIPTNNNQLTNGAGYVTSNTQLSNEQVQDIVGGMVSSNTESGITVTYQDGDGTIDFSVASQTDNNFTTTLKNKLDGIEASATADQTAAEILTAIKTVDGSGSGLDADTVDGLQASQFLRADAANTISSSVDQKLILAGSNAPYIRFQSGTTSAAYLQYDTSSTSIYLWNSLAGTGLRLTTTQPQWYNGSGYQKIWHAANDGAASGLDADQLDGIQASSFLRSDVDDTATGTLTVRDIKFAAGYHLQRSDHHSGHLEGSYNNVGANSYKTNPIYTIGSSYNPGDASLGNMYGIGYSNDNASFINFTGSSGWGMYVAADGDARVWLDGSNGVISSTGNHYVGSNVVWNAGNDGAGSGLDADTLDGLQDSSFLRSDTSDTFNGGTLTITPSNKIRLQDSGNANNFVDITNETLNSVARNHVSFKGTLLFRPGNNLGNDSVRITDTGTLQYSANGTTWLNFWHAGNDGAGSGLDADLLDGQHGSYYLNYNNFSNRPTIPTNNNQLTNGAGYVTSNTQLSNEQVQDIVGGMVSSNTESGITVTYQDSDGTLDFSVASQTDNNFTTTLKNKLDGIAASATNVTNNNQLTNGAGYITSFDITTQTDSKYLRSNADDTFAGDLTSSGNARILLKKTDNNVSDHIIFYNGTERVGEIGCEDNSYLRINQETNKNIYTPRFIRADNGFFVDGTSKGINGSGNFIGGTIAGASDYGTLLRSDQSDTMSGSLTTSSDSTFNSTRVGRGAGNISTNTVVGASGLNANTSGSTNTATGYHALYSNTTGEGNTANGNESLYNCNEGKYNVAIGSQALKNVTTGKANVGMGFLTHVGNYSPVYDPTSQSRRLVLGHTSIANAYVKVSFTVTSDARDKMNFAPVPYGLDFVNQLKPTAFQFKEDRDIEEPDGPVRYGFKAQDILALEGDSPVIIDTEDPDHLKYKGEHLVPILVNAVQELTSMVKNLQDEIAILKGS